MREDEIRAAIESHGPILGANSPVLCHGDLWPGNVLLRGGEIVGVIDWEEALIGEALADLGICRLDIWWILGEDASNEFTDRYRALVDLDTREQPFWDLCASLRPIRNIGGVGPGLYRLRATGHHGGDDEAGSPCVCQPGFEPNLMTLIQHISGGLFIASELFRLLDHLVLGGLV